MMINMEDQPQTPSVPTTNIPATEAVIDAQSPPVTQAPFTPTMPVTTNEKKPVPLIPILGGIILLLLVAVGVLFIQNQKPNIVPTEIVATPTIAPTPTPIRKPSALSLTDAFASFSAEKASFSTEINNFTFQEGLFTPPTLDLELGIND